MRSFLILIVFAVIVGVIAGFTQPFANAILASPALTEHVSRALPATETSGLEITLTSKERKQAQWVAEQLGGSSKYYFPQATGWAYNSGEEEWVTFTVPTGTVVETTQGLRYEGQKIKAQEFTIWWT